MGAPREMQLQKDGGEYVLSEPLCRELQQQKISVVAADGSEGTDGILLGRGRGDAAAG